MDKKASDNEAEGEKVIELFIRTGGNQNALKNQLRKLLSGNSSYSRAMISAWQEKADRVFKVYGVPEEKRNKTLHFDMNVRYNLVKNLLGELSK
ncbi:MAG TPA: hypothetical protein HA282_03240 [Nanoarchaeota archaeon]|nr:MAG: hypothetical protein QT01_C0007G0029 [archaeon GW2011_AR6]MBS3082322.1 hypothetical protein [Candidatus Pacearchaeota archaeon]HIH18096.1 hypothetical protein [Nanoarchaeota archaeon]HIH34013.1 hypothetical protein [Nanoarchaeota archaeon]HIH51048.1 hypothetical protein [Nanoarchaeota archaeon]